MRPMPGSRRADCRLCERFKPLDVLPPSLVERAYEWVHHNRPGEEPLGWCHAYNRPVTYYEGTCPRFKEKPPVFLRTRRLDEFIPGL